jgi:tetratricopeptide (TPR) repeat protein
MPYDRRPSNSGRPQRSGQAGRSSSGGRSSQAGRGRPGTGGAPGARRTGPRPATPDRARRDEEPGRPPRRDGGSSERPRRYRESSERSTTGYARPSRSNGGSARSGAGSNTGGRADTRPYGNDGRRSGPSPRRDPRAVPTEDGDRPRRYDPARPRPSAGRPGGRDRVPPRRVEAPRTAAQIRSAEVKAARGFREPRQQAEPAPWEREKWIDDGPLRSAARKATARAIQRPQPAEPIDSVSKTTRRRKSSNLAPDVADELVKTAPAALAAKYKERLTTAADALDRGRFDDARRMVQSVLRDLPEMAFGHEIAGLAFYRTGQWRKAAAELEVARQLDRTLNHHAVLADCYRALKRYDLVDQLWLELREGSPEPALMAEGRIVAAGALADQGDLKGALKLMERGAEVPKKVRDHHLRQWYVLGDLHDRSGDIIKARRFFGMIAAVDPQFADVADRLRGLGR